MHAGFLINKGKRMGKSNANFMTAREALNVYSSATLRFYFLSAHYRSPLDYAEDNLKQSEAAVSRLGEFVAKIGRFEDEMLPDFNEHISVMIQQFEKDFYSALEDDFNTPDALASLFSLLNALEKGIWNLNKSEASLIKKTLVQKMEIFGISLKKPAKIPAKITKKAKERELYRKNKQFIQSDELRKQINELGYNLDDTPFGQFVRPQ